MQKIILYYRFTPIKDPETLRLWQAELTSNLRLKGRIIISKHGINGTLGGEIDDLKSYIKSTKTFKPFKDIEYKWGDGQRDDFPRLSVRVRDEIVTFNAVEELHVDEHGVIGGGKKLKAAQVNKLISDRGDDVVFFDGRNAYEASIGKFKNAIVPDIQNTRDFTKELKKTKYNSLKNKAVITYCTGGVRCEVLSMLMKNRGFKEVYQIEGGIAKYGEKFADRGHWEGSLYVFDKRMGIKFSDESKDIGECIYCKGKTSRFINCANKSCNALVLVCKKCNQQTYCKMENLKSSRQLQTS